jgi:hypothetical protein
MSLSTVSHISSLECFQLRCRKHFHMSLWHLRKSTPSGAPILGRSHCHLYLFELDRPVHCICSSSLSNVQNARLTSAYHWNLRWKTFRPYWSWTMATCNLMHSFLTMSWSSLQGLVVFLHLWIWIDLSVHMPLIAIIFVTHQTCHFQHAQVTLDVAEVDRRWAVSTAETPSANLCQGGAWSLLAAPTAGRIPAKRIQRRLVGCEIWVSWQVWKDLNKLFIEARDVRWAP